MCSYWVYKKIPKFKFLVNILIKHIMFWLLWMSGQISGMDGQNNMEWMGYELMRYGIYYMSLTFDTTHDLDL